MSVPSTVNDVGCEGVWEIVVLLSVRSSPPAAAATPCSAATFATVLSLMGEADELARLSIVYPFLSEWHFPLVHIWAPFGPIVMLVLLPPPPLPVFGGDGAGPVTVTSVPTPYSPLRTPAWAFLTPAEAAVTVMTSPTPTASPSAMKIACLRRRRSSLARYVKKNMPPLYGPAGCAAVTRPA